MTALKWIVGLVILGGLGWLVWYSGWLNSFMTPSPAPTTTTQTATTTSPTPPPPPTDGMSASNDTTDAAVAQDTAAVDSQMQGLNSDSASIDSSLSDKAVTQSY